MDADSSYRPPVSIFVPALSAALVLTLLFYFGLDEQQKLAQTAITEKITEREQIAQLVAESIELDLQQTLASVQRFSRDLEVQLVPEQPATVANFTRQFELLKDGSTRSRRTQFDPITEAGVWLPNYTPISDELREFVVRAKTITETYGRGAYQRTFVDTWILPATGGIVIFWPDEREFVFQATADFDYRDTEWVKPTRPENNPNRHAYWTKLAFDPTPQIWMLSAVAPLYWRGQWFGSVGHDVPLTRLLERTALLRQHEGSQFLLMTDEQVIAASDRYADDIKAANGDLRLDTLSDPIWRDTLTRAQAQGISNQQHLRISVAQHIAFVSRIRGQNWLLINLLPLQPVTTRIHKSFTNLRNIAIASLLLELLITTAVLAWNQHRSRQFFNHRQHLLQQLSSSEEHYRTLVANVPGVVFRCAPMQPWTMQFISASISDLSGYPASDFINNSVRSFSSIIHPDDRGQDADIIASGLRDKRPYVTEYRIIRHDGAVRWVYEHARGIYDGDNAIAIQGVVLDTTPLKTAELQLQQLNATLETQVDFRTRELRTAIRDLESFNYAVSHDLRAPLRHLGSYLTLLHDDLGAHPALALVQRCDTAVKRMQDLIGGMLALSQLGRESLSPVTLDLHALVSDYIATLPVEVRQQVQFDLGPLPFVKVDRVLMRQVVQNLIDNAIKYSHKNPQPLISVHDCSDSNDSTEYIVEFRDNGAGFDAQYADKLFTLFQRMHRQEEFPGTGVGLALCAKILQLHNGRIWATAEVDKGASFFIALPK